MDTIEQLTVLRYGQMLLRANFALLTLYVALLWIASWIFKFEFKLNTSINILLCRTFSQQIYLDFVDEILHFFAKIFFYIFFTYFISRGNLRLQSYFAFYDLSIHIKIRNNLSESNIIKDN